LILCVTRGTRLWSKYIFGWWEHIIKIVENILFYRCFDCSFRHNKYEIMERHGGGKYRTRYSDFIYNIYNLYIYLYI
jgi:hypothetical protein